MLLFSLAAGSFAGKFEDAQENETSSFLPGGAESVKVVEHVKEFPAGEVANAVTVIARDGAPLGRSRAGRGASSSCRRSTSGAPT